jgi:hypothetical protein
MRKADASNHPPSASPRHSRPQASSQRGFVQQSAPDYNKCPDFAALVAK